MKDMADMDGPIWCYSVALKKRPIMNWLEMLNEVLRYHKPDTWDSVSYGQQRYRKVQVFGEEYDKIAGKFTPELRTHVQMIYRVQNPYLYGRYKLKVEQLQLKGQVYENINIAGDLTKAQLSKETGTHLSSYQQGKAWLGRDADLSHPHLCQGQE
ncbi:uncharacterized protein LOC110839909 isoform X4 [Zootermopsis nevadensis]|uniref:uncharacterized protein LOC110839909 isoform X4 n=1 Tax=Zootermopsis nevadensis TaxID=136037 RepID=UPI000B8EC03A|nr:uncharacterized protein LOC110839909 isoform X4 [Zootermopsis nevadensis]